MYSVEFRVHLGEGTEGSGFRVENTGGGEWDEGSCGASSGARICGVGFRV